LALAILYLFPDTNLFIQCRPLEQLDWSGWGSFHEIRLIVSRPVHKEIDYRKNKGSDRVGNRARATNAMFREITRGTQGHRVVREGSPSVKLFIEVQHLADPALTDRLDYGERDEELIGTIATFKQQHPDADVRLLTDDGTPMATAKSLGIAVAEIPDSWLVPPETTDAEKKIKALEAENARLRRSEPQLELRCLDGNENEIAKLEYTLERLEPLTDAQLTLLVKKIADHFPMATDFGSAESTKREPKGNLFPALKMQEVFVPASEEDIAAYRDNKYPQWLDSCRSVLAGYHNALNASAWPPTFYFAAANQGTRPAKDALITIEAQGNFLVMPPQFKKGTESKDDGADGGPPVLPRPPAPPFGKWQSRYEGTFSAFQHLARAQSHLLQLPRGLDIQSLALGVRDVGPFRRDPNAFYYKPDRSETPQPSFSLECAQWRHGSDNWEPFSGEIHFAETVDQVAGVLECRIHAENLSDLAAHRVPLRISVSSLSVFERAEILVQALITGGARGV
jgi:hypothetical protein